MKPQDCFNPLSTTLAALGYYGYTEYQAHRDGEFNLLSMGDFRNPNDFLAHGIETFGQREWVADFLANHLRPEYHETFSQLGFITTELLSWGLIPMAAAFLPRLCKSVFSLNQVPDLQRKQERKDEYRKLNPWEYLDVKLFHLHADLKDPDTQLDMLESLAQKYENIHAQFPITHELRIRMQKDLDQLDLPKLYDAYTRFANTWTKARLADAIPPLIRQHFGHQYMKSNFWSRFEKSPLWGQFQESDPIQAERKLRQVENLFNAAMMNYGSGFCARYREMLDYDGTRNFVVPFAEPELIKDPDQYFNRVGKQAEHIQNKLLFMLNLAENMTATCLESYSEIRTLVTETFEVLYPLLKKNCYRGENLERVGQTKNGVYLLLGNSQWRFKECRNQQAAQDEYEFTDYLGKLLKKTPHEVPIPITTFNYDKSVLLLEGVEGDTLEQKIQANDPHVPQYYE
ncbi:MAG: hypothetical protein ACQESG_04795, partial [Nanobdellota archaeon]